MTKRVTKSLQTYLADLSNKGIDTVQMRVDKVGKKVQVYLHPFGKHGESIDFTVEGDVTTCVTVHADDCKCGSCHEVCRCNHDESQHKKIPAQGPDHPAMVVCCADKFCFCYKYEVAK